MAVTRGIFREHDVAGTEPSHRTVADFDLDLPGKGNDILAPRRRVIIAPMRRRHTAKENPLHRLKLGYLHVSPEVKFNINFLEMRFIVRTGVKSNDLHELGCRRIVAKKQGNLKEFQSFQPFQSFQMLNLNSLIAFNLRSPTEHENADSRHAGMGGRHPG
jgi:hypothetical protein